MDILKRENKNCKVFNCNDVAQVISEICGISKKKIYVPWQLRPNIVVWFNFEWIFDRLSLHYTLF